MTCPACGGQKNDVVNKRDRGESIYRRRRCRACGARWTTYEHRVTAPRKRGER